MYNLVVRPTLFSLVYLVMTSEGFSSSPAAGPQPQNAKRCRAVIIGAGASGLTAAKQLLRKINADVSSITDDRSKIDPVHPLLVLEARDRVGGRIHTVRRRYRTMDGHEKCIPVDEGAAWVHGVGVDESSDVNPILELLVEGAKDDRESPLNLVSPHGNPWTHPRLLFHGTNTTKLNGRNEIIDDLIAIYTDGKRIPSRSPCIDQALEVYERRLRAVNDFANSTAQGREEISVVNTSLGQALKELDAECPQGFCGLVKENDEGCTVVSLSSFFMFLQECWHSAPISSLQLSEFVTDDDGTCEEGDFPGAHCTVRDGMSSVLSSLLREEGLSERIMCGEEVVKIIKTEGDEEGGVKVLCSSGLVVCADLCVVTIPLGCLQVGIAGGDSGLFHPRLSKEKEKAIGSIQMGKYKKVMLTFSHIFWPISQPFIGLILEGNKLSDRTNVEYDGLGKYLLVDNLWAKDGIPCLEAVLVGHAADWATEKSDDDIIFAILEMLQDTMFGSKELAIGSFSVKDHLVDTHITRWEEDKFSAGAYSGYGLGTTEMDFEMLKRSEWDGLLFFAGEATDPIYQGSVHAALMSGVRAADEVIESLQ